jgi:hypothetical protein
MLKKKACIVAILGLFLIPYAGVAQKTFTSKSPSKNMVDSMMMESNVFFFKQTSISPDTAKAMLKVRVLEKDGSAAPIQGATVLLRRDNDKMLGRVTRPDGRCLFEPSPALYTIRVQMTGLKTLEKTGFALESGKVYELEVRMAPN